MAWRESLVEILWISGKGIQDDPSKLHRPLNPHVFCRQGLWLQRAAGDQWPMTWNCLCDKQGFFSPNMAASLHPSHLALLMLAIVRMHFSWETFLFRVRLLFFARGWRDDECLYHIANQKRVAVHSGKGHCDLHPAAGLRSPWGHKMKWSKKANRWSRHETGDLEVVFFWKSKVKRHLRLMMNTWIKYIT